MKKTVITSMCVVLLSISSLVYGIGAAIDTDFPKDARIDLSLKIEGDGSGTLEIHNISKKELELQTLSNRLVLAFLVMDQYGNIIKPVGKAKVDPVGLTYILEAGNIHIHEFKNRDFLTGTALFGYDFEKGRKYRVVAVYRPAGPNGPGFSSNEYVFEYK